MYSLRSLFLSSVIQIWGHRWRATMVCLMRSILPRFYISWWRDSKKWYIMYFYKGETWIRSQRYQTRKRSRHRWNFQGFWFWIRYQSRHPWQATTQGLCGNPPLYGTSASRKKAIHCEEWYLEHWSCGLWDAVRKNSLAMQRFKFLRSEHEDDDSQIPIWKTHLRGNEGFHQEIPHRWWECQTGMGRCLQPPNP